jgi:ATP-dependent Zn protease
MPTTRPPINPCSQYEVNDVSTLYSVLNETEPSMQDTMLRCLQQQIITKGDPLYQDAINYGNNKIESISAIQKKVNIDIIYQDNLFYTISKVFMFILLIGAYIYFFKDSGIFQPIKNGAKMVKENLDKVKDIKIPQIKLPEVTMPSIKMPTK